MDSNDHARKYALDGVISTKWKDNFVSGGNTVGMKKYHWMQIALVEEMVTVGVKITAMRNNKATDIFRNTYISAGINPTTLAHNEDATDLHTHNELSVYYEGPAERAAELYLKFDKPVNTKYIFIQAKLDNNGRWGFSEIEVMTSDYWLSYCMNADPLNGIEDSQKASVGSINNQYSGLIIFLH